MAEEIKPPDTDRIGFAPLLPQAVIYMNDTTIKFCLKGETLLSISKDRFEAKDMAPIKTTEELHYLLLEFFRKANRRT